MNDKEGLNLLDYLATGINKNDPVIQAIFSDYEGKGAIANEIEEIITFIDYYTKTDDIRNHTGASLEMISKQFAQIKRQLMETDDRLLRRTLALTERKGDLVWGNALNMKHSLETYFEHIHAYISENTDDSARNLLKDSDFAEDAWTLSGAATYSFEARFSGKRGLYLDGHVDERHIDEDIGGHIDEIHLDEQIDECHIDEIHLDGHIDERHLEGQIDGHIDEIHLDERHIDEDIGGHVDEIHLNEKIDECHIDEIHLDEQIDRHVDEIHLNEKIDARHIDDHLDGQINGHIGEIHLGHIDEIHLEGQIDARIDDIHLDRQIDERHIDEDIGGHVDEIHLNEKIDARHIDDHLDGQINGHIGEIHLNSS